MTKVYVITQTGNAFTTNGLRFIEHMPEEQYNVKNENTRFRCESGGR